MRYYRVNEDWLTHFEGDFREQILHTLRGLDLACLQKYPPPKLNGLPFGNETRILSRFVRGQSSQLDASALSSMYRAFMTADKKLLYRAFRMNEPLSENQWSKIIGAENIGAWVENKCLKPGSDGSLWAQFSVVSIDGLNFCVEPMKDHGRTWEPDFLVEKSADNSSEIAPFYHTYMGLDSLRMIEEMEKTQLPSRGRYLDCGPGSGSLLLYFARRFDESVGIDLNPRAAKLAQFNADLNNISNCKTYCDNAIELGDKYGKFDLVSWNLPFIFLPEDYKDIAVDGYGGEMGIGLCLDFVEVLPELLADGGMAFVAALAPILDSGENVLEERLGDRLPRLGLDCTVNVSQISLAHTRELWEFHRGHNIKKFEAVYLSLRAGTGKIDRVKAPFIRRGVDALREKLYSRKFR
jgi:hypothetical protein